MSTKTKMFHSAVSGAPVLTGEAGSLIALLDALLVNGYGSTSVVSATVLDEVCTLTYASGHPHAPDAVLLLAGATSLTGINGQKRVSTTAANTVTFPAPGVANGSATGTITSKVAPAGWTKAFTGTNKAAYKSAGPEGTGCYLRVDDSAATYARVRGYEAMTDADTGTGLFPSSAQQSGDGYWWSKSDASSSSPRPWRVLADEYGFYYFPKQGGSTTESQGNFFGDFKAVKSNDPYSCALRANTTSRAASAGAFADDLVWNDTSQGNNSVSVARAANSIGGAVYHSTCSVFTPNTVGAPFGNPSFTMPYPSPIDNGLVLADVAIYNVQGLRGWMPGIKAPTQYVALQFADGDIVYGTGDLTGKKVVACKFGALTGGNCGMLFIDPITDWR